jgi:hypothetical protein
MTPKPPQQSSFSEVSGLLSQHSELGLAPASLRIRTVATRTANKWYNFASSVTLVDDSHRLERVVELRNDVMLVETSLPLNGPLHEDDLRRGLSHWRELLATEHGFQFNSTVYLYRHYTDLRDGARPRWCADLTENLQDRPSYQAPSGPFLSKSEQLFAPDLARLASMWLGESRWLQQTTLAHAYSLTIPDRRAELVSLEAEADHLSVTIRRLCSDALNCCVTAESFAGSSRTFIEEISDTKVGFRLPFAVQGLQVWLTLEDGYPLDHYNESPRSASWGNERSLYNAPARETAHLSAISQALAGGETSTVEFKPYIRLRRRDKKADEVLEAICAFANAAGGDIYLGVTDYGEPVGIENELHHEYDKDHSGDLQRVQDAYVRDIRKLLNEGLLPAAMPEVQWHDIAHRLILQVRVQPSQQPSSLISTGEVFRRVGATNRKVRPIDLTAPGADPMS